MKKIGAVEAMRGLAATYVFLGHVAIEVIERNSPLLLPMLFGQEAVMLFFIVSGFVIVYSMEGARDRSFASYIDRRFFRIYPIFILSLVISAATADKGSVATFFGNLFMLQDFKYGKPGVLFDTFGGNVALWSLSYEWWFYLMFYPLWRYVPERRQFMLVAVVGLAAAALFFAVKFQPLLFLAYFPVWWAGVEMGRAVFRGQPMPFGRILTVLALLTAVFAAGAGLEIWRARIASFGLHPVLELRHISASLIFVIVLALYMRFRPFDVSPLLKPFEKLAPISYALYALHMTVIVYVVEEKPSKPVMALTMLTIPFLLAWFGEKPYQSAVMWLRARVRARLGAPAAAR